MLKQHCLDDATLAGPVETIRADLETVIQMAEEVGLELNLGKCEAFAFSGDEHLDGGWWY